MLKVALDSPGHRSDPQQEDLEDRAMIFDFESLEGLKGMNIVYTFQDSQRKDP